MLLYADDVVLLAESEFELQKQLDVLYNWCTKWQLEINYEKSNIVHFRPPLGIYLYHFSVSDWWFTAKNR